VAAQRITRKSAKQRGRSLQQYACRKISELTGYEWGSSGEDKPIESRPMGQTGPDVRLDDRVLEQFPYAVECKNVQSWSVPSWIEQAKQNRWKGSNWLIIAKRNHKRPVVILDADAFFKLLEQNRKS